MSIIKFKNLPPTQIVITLHICLFILSICQFYLQDVLKQYIVYAYKLLIFNRVNFLRLFPSKNSIEPYLDLHQLQANYNEYLCTSAITEYCIGAKCFSLAEM
jgi:hypothetical protein